MVTLYFSVIKKKKKIIVLNENDYGDRLYATTRAKIMIVSHDDELPTSRIPYKPYNAYYLKRILLMLTNALCLLGPGQLNYTVFMCSTWVHRVAYSTEWFIEDEPTDLRKCLGVTMIYRRDNRAGKTELKENENRPGG